MLGFDPLNRVIVCLIYTRSKSKGLAGLTSSKYSNNASLTDLRLFPKRSKYSKNVLANDLSKNDHDDLQGSGQSTCCIFATQEIKLKNI